MMGEWMTPDQKMIIWCLLGLQGEALEAQIKPKIKAGDRTALVADGFISTDKIDRANSLRLEPKGLEWAAGHLLDDLPPAYEVLQHWLARLHHLLQKTGTNLPDIVELKPPRPKPPEKPKKASKPKAASKPPTLPQIRKRIDAAYLVVTEGHRGEFALLSRVRAELADLDRLTVDKGLAAILKDGKKATLSQISDPKALTPEERDAAYSPGGEAFNLLWIKP
jgi:hypothetical protein